MKFRRAKTAFALTRTPRAVGLTICVAIFAAACDFGRSEPAIEACENLLKDRLKSPASYKRVAAAVEGDSVSISYDAANSFNAILRGSEVCRFYRDEDRKIRIAQDATLGWMKCEKEVRGYSKERGWSVGYLETVLRLSCGEKRAGGLLEQVRIQKVLGRESYPISPERTGVVVSNVVE